MRGAARALDACAWLSLEKRCFPNPTPGPMSRAVRIALERDPLTATVPTVAGVRAPGAFHVGSSELIQHPLHYGVTRRRSPELVARSIRYCEPCRAQEDGGTLSKWTYTERSAPIRTGRGDFADGESPQAGSFGLAAAGAPADPDRGIAGRLASARYVVNADEEAYRHGQEQPSQRRDWRASPMELETINADLTASIISLRDALDRQRAVADDLRNVLFSADVATLVLDDGLRLRMFTPAAKALFELGPDDCGRALGELDALACDSALFDDARAVMRSGAPRGCEMSSRTGCRHVRRALAYRGRNGAVEGVVITFIACSLKHRAVAQVRDPPPPGSAETATIHVIDGDCDMRESLRAVLGGNGWRVATYENVERFLAASPWGAYACLVADARLPGMDGVGLLQRLSAGPAHMPAVLITGARDVAGAVAAMKAGAVDLIEKPIAAADLLSAVARALTQARDVSAVHARREASARRVASLTPREREIMGLVLEGHPSKNIASDLGISRRTVENHRAAVMSKTGAKSLPALARLALAAERPSTEHMPAGYGM